MTPNLLSVILIGAAVSILIVYILWIGLAQNPERGTIVTLAATLLAIIVGLAGVAAQVDSYNADAAARAIPAQTPASTPAATPAPAPSAGGGVAVNSPSPAAREPRPGVTSLPADSPDKETGEPNIDNLCEHLGYAKDGWTPGQTAPHDYNSRRLYGPGFAYQWRCGSATGPLVTYDQVNAFCGLIMPGTRAYTWDPDYSYSWACLVAKVE
jgi:hypothetical protein